ncbi:unnamed protein product [Haemonchus placei]|uniref:Uma2 domain-containing protein n=1 Tax=Haemonchus placei TaxID=6290 RepID=A0A0N4WKL8_HAEPC|nr:unnamed protein product [Haemonchus placei]
MIPEIQLQSPWRTFEQRFQEYRCCDDKDFKREVRRNTRLTDLDLFISEDNLFVRHTFDLHSDSCR